MIFHENGVFHLQTECYSYLFRVNPWGLLEHLHFGTPVQTADWAGFVCNSGLGWGSSALLDEKNTGSCADVLPLEWSGSGRGDYRETPMEMDGCATDFRYEGFEILEGIASMDLPQARDGGETLVITMKQHNARLRLYYTAFETALTRRVVLENTGDKALTITKLMSQCVDLPGDFEITTFNGGWIAEMGKTSAEVTATRMVSESTTGASSNRHNPGFLLNSSGATEDHGCVYGFNLVYSGNHYASAQKSLQGLTRVMQGISADHFAWSLAPREVFETPEAVLCWSGEGFNGLSARMHRFVNEHIVPKYWRYRHRPVLYNDWEGCMFDFNHRRLMGLAGKAKRLGCELFVLDDGWFGKRNNDQAGLGDYTVNKKKLPHGLKGLSRDVRKLGMEFGLWFEPESVNMDSDLYRAHPDWALTDAFSPVLGRNQLLLDLTKPEVRDYIVENVSAILDSGEISYVKWDMNRHSIALGAKAHRFVLGLYDVLGRIFGPRPQILLETCSSGGNRFDLGMLCFGPQVWCSDNTDPISRLDIQGGLSYLYPQSTFGAHVSAAPHAQTLRHTPLTTRGNVSFFGVLGYELDLKHLVKVEMDEIKAQIAFYKEYRKLFQFGTFRRSENGWQVSDGQTVLAGVFHKQMNAAPGYERLRVPGLAPKRPYALITRPQGLRIGQFGALVKHVAPVNLNPNGLILRTADRLVTLPDGQQKVTVSGAALDAGIMLQPLFRGTGYDQNQRTQLDFGSNLYIIKAEE